MKQIVTGDENACFMPLNDVTREQAMTMLYRFVQATGEGFTGDWMFPLTFDDAAEVSDWANEAVHYGVMKQVLQGDDQNCVNPGESITRAEFVTMLYRLANAD